MKNKSKFLTALLLCSSAQAAYFDGNILLARMNGTTQERMQALGYIQGVHDTLQDFVVCSPANVTAGQVMDMTKNFLDNTPAIRHLNADAIVMRVLATTWPCAVQKNNSSNKNRDTL